MTNPSEARKGLACCWACPATCPAALAGRQGWRRRLFLRHNRSERETYCPACFAAHGWPECPPPVSAETVRKSVGYDLPRVYRVGC